MAQGKKQSGTKNTTKKRRVRKKAPEKKAMSSQVIKHDEPVEDIPKVEEPVKAEIVSEEEAEKAFEGGKKNVVAVKEDLANVSQDPLDAEAFFHETSEENAPPASFAKQFQDFLAENPYCISSKKVLRLWLVNYQRTAYEQHGGDNMTDEKMYELVLQYSDGLPSAKFIFGMAHKIVQSEQAQIKYWRHVGLIQMDIYEKLG